MGSSFLLKYFFILIPTLKQVSSPCAYMKKSHQANAGFQYVQAGFGLTKVSWFAKIERPRSYQAADLVTVFVSGT